jgi:hypothetical protein
VSCRRREHEVRERRWGHVRVARHEVEKLEATSSTDNTSTIQSLVAISRSLLAAVESPGTRLEIGKRKVDELD